MRSWLAELPLPKAAIGGITLEQAPPLLEAGFGMLAVIHDIFSRQDIEARCRHYAALWQRPVH
jgi:thiamine-phosphate pyrophosphorylase